MSEEMSYRYMSQVPEDFKIDDNGASTHDEMSNDQMYCQTEDFYTPVIYFNLILQLTSLLIYKSK
jgi:hypothetical protein